MSRMKYPEKYPNGFMYAVVNDMKTVKERAETIREGSQYFLDMIKEALNGFVVTDAPMVLVALQVYSDAIKLNEAGADELAARILEGFQVERAFVYLPHTNK